MKCLVLLALVGFAAAQTGGNNNNRFQGQFVWDLLKPALTAGEVEILLASRDANNYPTYNGIPQTSFACNGRVGFYADVDAQCQVFHRCDINGNMTSYLCVNSTIFNQITLICDAWYNVDCANSPQYESYANSRLYTDLPLFDTPPADYLTPAQRAQQAADQQAVGGAGSQAGQPTAQQRPQASASRIQARPRPAGGQLRVNTLPARAPNVRSAEIVVQPAGQAQAGRTQDGVDQSQTQDQTQQ
ncbi:hypothetical protein RvY_07189 [Ramazzottius varieornatus]|uniref:Chitin-binding type-2 domain-containing protein n=1 Tax=Ramazzottius varieornatus TaxID=947166 RepID=A0A1D1V9R7_RAMVA|nr:hypothetical protein RvY_07189 [Ramazzottius varieornatus]